MSKICPICKNVFDKRKTTYCSRKCFHIHLGNFLRGKPLSAKHRKKMSENNSHYWLGKKQSTESNIKRANALRGKKRPPFSSLWRKHIGDSARGKKGWRWQGGSKTKGKYRKTIRIHNNPFYEDGNKYLYSRFVMEKHIGRFLKPEEVVHHKNNDCSDDRIENLQLFSSDAEHIHFHNSLIKS